MAGKAREVKDLSEYCLSLANALSWSESRMKALHPIWGSDEFDQLPEEIKRALKGEIESLDCFMHIAIGAFTEGFISYEEALSRVSQDFGSRGAARLERIMQDHAHCWADLRKHGFEEWTPERAKAGSEKVAQIAAEKPTERFEFAEQIVAKLMGLSPEEIGDACEVVRAVESASTEDIRNAFGHALGYLTRSCMRLEPELTTLLGAVSDSTISVVLARKLLEMGAETSKKFSRRA